MGKLINGINGPFTGKIGKVHGSSRNGVPHVKGPYKKRTKKISKKETGNRFKFALAQSWLKPLLPFVREGFRDPKRKGVGFIEAKSYLMKQALSGEGMELRIDPALMLVSRGSLPLPGDIAVEKTADGQLQFSWDKSPVDNGSNADQVMLLAYDIDHAEAYYTVTGQFRSTGMEVLKVMAGRTYHLYLAFTADDRTKQSDSVYLGTMAM